VTVPSSQSVFSLSIPLACAALGAGISLGCSARIDGFISLGTHVGGSAPGATGATGGSLAAENGTGGSASGSSTASGNGSGGTDFGSGSGGASFGSGSGGTASTPASSTTGGTLGPGDTGTGYDKAGCGSGSPAGYSSCGWDVARDIAQRCGYPPPSYDYHGITVSLTRCTPWDYLVTFTPTQDCYRNGVTLDIPVVTSQTSEVTVGTRYASDTPGVFEYPMHSTVPIEQSLANFLVRFSVTCKAGDPALSIQGICGWYPYR
jgi:hypothetical protein